MNSFTFPFWWHCVGTCLDRVLTILELILFDMRKGCSDGLLWHHQPGIALRLRPNMYVTGVPRETEDNCCSQVNRLQQLLNQLECQVTGSSFTCSSRQHTPPVLPPRLGWVVFLRFFSLTFSPSGSFLILPSRGSNPAISKTRITLILFVV